MHIIRNPFFFTGKWSEFSFMLSMRISTRIRNRLFLLNDMWCKGRLLKSVRVTSSTTWHWKSVSRTFQQKPLDNCHQFWITKMVMLNGDFVQLLIFWRGRENSEYSMNRIWWNFNWAEFQWINENFSFGVPSYSVHTVSTHLWTN